MKESYRHLVNSYNYKDSLTHIEPISIFNYKEMNLTEVFEVMPDKSYFVLDLDPVDPLINLQRFTVVKANSKIAAFNDEIIAIYDAVMHRDSVYFNPTEDRWIDVFKVIGFDNININHYKYCDFMLDHFWMEIFNKTPDEMFCAGIVSAHGDKAYGYQSQWKKADIPFTRGVLLFLLTYTKLYKDNCSSREWVIDAYEQYLPVIEKVEKEVFFLS